MTGDPNALLIDTVIIEGDLRVGETISATVEFKDQNTHALDPSDYQWYRDGQPISGAIYTAYVIKEEDIGKSITVGVTPNTFDAQVNPGPEVLSEAFLVPPDSAPDPNSVWLTGIPNNGEPVTAHYSIEDNSYPLEVSFQWYRSGVEINGANDSIYTLTETDSAQTLTVEVTVTLENVAEADSGRGLDSLEVYGKFISISPEPLAIETDRAPNSFHMLDYQGQLVIVFMTHDGQDVRNTWTLTDELLKKVEEKTLTTQSPQPPSLDYLKQENGWLYLQVSNAMESVFGDSGNTQTQSGVFKFSGGNSWVKEYNYWETEMQRPLTVNPSGIKSLPVLIEGEDTIDTSATLTVPYNVNKNYMYGLSHVMIYRDFNPSRTILESYIDIVHYQSGAWTHHHRFPGNEFVVDGFHYSDNKAAVAVYEVDTSIPDTPVVIYDRIFIYTSEGESNWTEQFDVPDPQSFDFVRFQDKIYYSFGGWEFDDPFELEIRSTRTLKGNELGYRPDLRNPAEFYIAHESPNNVYTFSFPKDSLVFINDTLVTASILPHRYIMKNHPVEGWQLMGQKLFYLYAMCEYKGEMYIISQLRKSYTVGAPEVEYYYLARYMPFTKP